MYWYGSLVNINTNSIDTDKYGADISKNFVRNENGYKLELTTDYCDYSILSEVAVN